MLRIIEQIASYGRSLDNIEQRKAADILIAPDVKQYSIVDFAAKKNHRRGRKSGYAGP